MSRQGNTSQGEGSSSAGQPIFIPRLGISNISEVLNAHDRSSKQPGNAQPTVQPFYGNAASRTAESILELPLNKDAVCICETGGSRGLGVFARDTYPAQRRIIWERPALGCAMVPSVGRAFDLPRANIKIMWDSIGYLEKDDLKQGFWKLRFVSDRGNPEIYSSRRLQSFMREYGFLKTGGQRRVLVYRLASRINHACRTCANAEYTVDSEDGRISITVNKEVHRGEEIMINYGRSSGQLACCVCSTSKARDKIGSAVDDTCRWLSGLFWSGQKEFIGDPNDVINETLPPEDIINLLKEQAKMDREIYRAESAKKREEKAKRKEARAERRESSDASSLLGRTKGLFKQRGRMVQVNVSLVDPVDPVQPNVTTPDLGYNTGIMI